METSKCLQSCAVMVLLVSGVTLLENGLARTPPMGWMSWGYYMCADKCTQHPDKCLDEKLILSVADSFYKEGYQEAGFEYIIIDDCWAEKERDEAGRLVADRKRFPRGIKFIADYIHSRGLKFGMYTNIAAITCMGYPGSKGNFDTDARTFAEWGVDYIKVDGCFVTEQELDTAYIEFGQQLNKTGRSIVYSCSWPYYKYFLHKHQPNYTAISSACNLWRNYHDVSAQWDSVKGIMRYYQTEHRSLRDHHGPGHWNDPDMLLLGTGALTESQARTQVAVYVMLSAPLLLSCPMDRLTDYERSLLTNLELMAIGQDALGVMATPHELSKGLTMWVKRHQPAKGDVYHSLSLAFVNLNKNKQYAHTTLVDLGLNCTGGYTVMDKFTGTFIRNVTIEDDIEVVVPPEDVLLYTLYAV